MLREDNISLVLGCSLLIVSLVASAGADTTPSGTDDVNPGYVTDYSLLDHCLLLKRMGKVIPSIFDLRNSCYGSNGSVTSCRQDAVSPHMTCASTLAKISDIFLQEPLVTVIDTKRAEYIDWLVDAMDEYADWTSESDCSLILITPPVIDRQCLMTPRPTRPQKSPLVTTIYTNTSVSHIVEEVNRACQTFRTTSGKLNQHGLHEEYIKQNLFSVSHIPQHVTSGNIFSNSSKPSRTVPVCERVTIDSWEMFFMDYLQLSKPVVITNALNHWKASSAKWSNDYLRQKYGNKSVHIKLSPSTDYEGIENAKLWKPFNSNFKIPQSVLAKLPFPDLVVPRPATANMRFSDYLDLMESISNGSITNASAYLEYSSLSDYFPELLHDISEMEFLLKKLELRHVNMWLSDGNTIGKLHFDPYDNFLCMIDGRKELTLFEPFNNSQLYEAHIPEAQFSVHLGSLKFTRNKLLESTSMVMSPFDIKKPDFKRFPLFRETMPLNCTINEGEVLFMPAFWWHEVKSSPNPSTNRNLAINYWYEPFLTKAFPCPECQLKVNPKYFHLL